MVHVHLFKNGGTVVCDSDILDFQRITIGSWKLGRCICNSTNYKQITSRVAFCINQVAQSHDDPWSRACYQSSFTGTTGARSLWLVRGAVCFIPDCSLLFCPTGMLAVDFSEPRYSIESNYGCPGCSLRLEFSAGSYDRQNFVANVRRKEMCPSGRTVIDVRWSRWPWGSHAAAAAQNLR